MARRGLWVGVRLGPFTVGGRVGRKPRRPYQPGVSPVMQPTVRDMFREMRRRKAQGR